MTDQLTQQQAIALFDSRFWESMTPRDIAVFQLFNEFTCVPFRIFIDALEVTLGRGLSSGEFLFPDHFKTELLGDRERPTFAELLKLIPADKRHLAVSP